MTRARYSRVPITYLIEKIAIAEDSRRTVGEPIKAPHLTVGELMRLVGSGPAEPILVALGRRPLRTKQLTARVSGFSARSIYRSLAKLEAAGLVERRERQGVPSTVLLRLSEPSGRNLFRLLPKLNADSLCLLADLWEDGFAGELSRGPGSLTELVELPHHLTYHQVRRRTQQLSEGGLIDSQPFRGNGRRYYLSERGRRSMSVIASIGRWRHRHGLSDGTTGFSLEEMATVLRAALPLTSLPEHAGKSINVTVTGAEDRYGRRETKTLQAAVAEDGGVRITPRDQPATGSAAATINTWFAALLDDNRGRIRVRGDLSLVDACLTQLYCELWRTSMEPSRA